MSDTRPPTPIHEHEFKSRGLAALRAETELTLSHESTGPTALLSSGRRVAYFRETYDGVPILGNSRTVVFSPEGVVQDLTGTPSVLPGAPVLDPNVSAPEAVHLAISELFRTHRLPPDLPVDTRPAVYLTKPSGADRSCVLTLVSHDEPIEARLVLDPTCEPPLCWRLVFPFGEPAASVLVSALEESTPRVFAIDRDASMMSTRLSDPAGSLVETTLPPPPPRFPAGWLEAPGGAWFRSASGRSLTGNNVRLRGPSGIEFSAEARGGDLLVAATGHELAGPSLSAFYWANYMHDALAGFGFGEREGAMQERNLTSPGDGDGDPIEIRVIDDWIGTPGNFQSKPDGTSPVLRLGRESLHGASDPHIVIHEYCHGLVNRLVDGRDVADPLQGEQPEALGEGFCDYFAISLLNWCNDLDDIGPRWGFGSWCSEIPGGLRSASYDAHPGHYRELEDGSRDSIHSAGEVWAALLLDLHRIIADGADTSDAWGWWIAVDALKRLHQGGGRGPHFVHAAAAWLASFEDLGTREATLLPLRPAVAEAFAARGLGPSATSDGVRFTDARPSPDSDSE